MCSKTQERFCITRCLRDPEGVRAGSPNKVGHCRVFIDVHQGRPSGDGLFAVGSNNFGVLSGVTINDSRYRSSLFYSD